MQHLFLVFAFVVWLGLNVLLAYFRPDGTLWLIGSAILGVGWFAFFFKFVTAPD